MKERTLLSVGGDVELSRKGETGVDPFLAGAGKRASIKAKGDSCNDVSWVQGR